MAKLMQLEVVTPDKSLLTRDDISYVLAETVTGGIGILANHAPLIATLVEAPMKFKDANEKTHYVFLDGGFMEVKENRVTILSVGAEFAADIDLAKAERNFAKSKNRLENPEATTDIPAVEQALRRAKARIKTVELAQKL